MIINDEDIDALNKKGLDHYRAKEFDESIQYYNMAIEIKPDFVEALVNKGNSLFALGKNEDAINCYENAEKIDKKCLDKWDWIEKGNELFTKGEYEDAMKFYDKAIEKDKDFEDPYRFKGLSLHNLGRYDEAIRYYDTALKMNPINPEVLVDKGNAISILGWFDEADKCYDEALNIDPNFVISFISKGVNLHNLGKIEEAIKYYDKALEIDSDSAWAWYLKGNALIRLNKYSEAIKCSDLAIKIDANLSEAWLIKGESHLAVGEYLEAEKCFKNTLSKNSRNFEALYDLGLIYSEYIFNYSTALEMYRKILVFDPDNQLAKSAVAENLIKVKEYKESRKYAIEVLNEADDVILQSVIRVFIALSYFLEKDSISGGKEITNFFEYFRNLEEDFKIDEEDYLFKGIIDFVKNSEMDEPTRFLILSIIDLLQGKLEKKDFTFFDEKSIESKPAG
jgi:tetratricopeptide (TPR) repeat protein